MTNYLCQFLDWGLISYQDAYQRQKELVDKVSRNDPQKLIVCEHPAVLTCGRTSKPGNLLVNEEILKSRGIEVLRVDRGGDITLHSPGQMVIYPIFDLNFYGRDLHVFLRKLEQVVIDLLSDFDIVAIRIPGKTGVWVGGKKIASIGIGVRKWVSFHGVGLNIDTELSLFSVMRPCGLDVEMTSLARIKATSIDKIKLVSRLKENFRREFNLTFG
ncbi:MAG: lipoyl(octanoyl) transferase LipB [Candidatus Omnitrophica bacterium]|nr:lipoyl(octanoyl) transferase LipB [Candidatus Omnitrophota bacterium]